MPILYIKKFNSSVELRDPTSFFVPPPLIRDVTKIIIVVCNFDSSGARGLFRQLITLLNLLMIN